MDTRPHVLFVEDDRDTGEVLELLLRQAGFFVSVTADPSEVLELVTTDGWSGKRAEIISHFVAKPDARKRKQEGERYY